jgi:hypothetical protein
MWLDADETHLFYDTRQPMLSDVLRPELLDEFVGLEKANPQDILRFARKYGVLSLRAIREEGVHSEKIEIWREFVKRARATLSVAACIRQGRSAPVEEWARLRPWWSEYPSGSVLLQFEDVMNAWLRRSEVRPSFVWPSGMVFTNLHGVDEGSITMLGVLALQLAAAAKGAKEITTCDNCGNPYVRRGRRAQAGRHNYCPRCGVRAAWRNAQAKRRNELRAQKKRGAQKRTRGGR